MTESSCDQLGTHKFRFFFNCNCSIMRKNNSCGTPDSVSLASLTRNYKKIIKAHLTDHKILSAL